MIMCTNASVKHCVPTPERLVPEWLRPREVVILHHAFVATPRTVHRDVDRAGLAENQIECRFDLNVDAMITPDAGNPLLERPVIPALSVP